MDSNTKKIEIAILGLEFETHDKLMEYWKAHYSEIRDLTKEIDGFIYNIHNVCLNPNITRIDCKQGGYCEIKTSKWKGKWLVGSMVMTPMSGSGGGCHIGDPLYDTEEDAIKAELQDAIKHDHGKITEEMKKYYNEHYRIRQMTLFDYL